jgi:hypothetical protein
MLSNYAFQESGKQLNSLSEHDLSARLYSSGIIDEPTNKAPQPPSLTFALKVQ